MRFRTTIVQSGKNTTGIQVPDEVVEALGSGKRPAVKVTVNGYSYRSTVASMGGVFMVSLSAEHRAGAGVGGGDEVEVDLELDSAPREVTVPPELVAALDAEPAARATFDGLSYSNRSWHVLQVTGAKTEETRQRRIARSVEALKQVASLTSSNPTNYTRGDPAAPDHQVGGGAQAGPPPLTTFTARHARALLVGTRRGERPVRHPPGVVAGVDQLLELAGHAGVQRRYGQASPMHLGDELAGVAARADVVAVHLPHPSLRSLPPSAQDHMRSSTTT